MTSAPTPGATVPSIIVPLGNRLKGNYQSGSTLITRSDIPYHSWCFHLINYWRLFAIHFYDLHRHIQILAELAEKNKLAVQVPYNPRVTLEHPVTKGLIPMQRVAPYLIERFDAHIETRVQEKSLQSQPLFHA